MWVYFYFLWKKIIYFFILVKEECLRILVNVIRITELVYYVDLCLFVFFGCNLGLLYMEDFIIIFLKCWMLRGIWDIDSLYYIFIICLIIILFYYLAFFGNC